MSHGRPSDDDQLLQALRSAGDVGRDLLAVNWDATPVGRPETWPTSLRTVVRLVVSSRFSMWMAWGPELTFFCNDAYRRDTLGTKYPWALGRPAREVWAEIWPDIGPRIETVLSTGEATWDESLLLFLERSGYEEETYHTFSYSPLPDEHGAIAGLLCVVSEDTERVIGERRIATLRDLGSVSTAQRTERDFLDAAAAPLATNAQSLPFTAVYLFDDAGDAQLISTTGLKIGDPAAPAQIRAGDADPVWPAAQLWEAPETAVVVDGIDRRFHTLPAGAWTRPPTQAIAAALQDPAGGRPLGCLVVGANRHRPLDDSYLSFVALIAQRLSSGVASARAYATERARVEELAALDQAKTAFFSNVSHELRTPLTLMLGPLQDAIEDEGAIAPGQVELVHRNGVRLLKLVNTLLDFSRLEAGRLRAEFRPVDVAALTGQLVGTFRDACQRAGLGLTVEAEPLPGEVYLDPDLWERIVLNLVSNAFKFTLQGAITVTLRPAGDALAMTVADTGPGIPENELARVFERFHRVAATTGRSHEGTGIGLALVKELVQLHGGEITAESVLGEGSRFTVTLPLGHAHLPADQVSATPAVSDTQIESLFAGEALNWLGSEGAEGAGDPAGPGSAHAAPPAAGRARVLIADDNPDLRGYLARLLAPTWDVETVGDGREALDRIESDPPDLLITDVMMPGLDGFELLAAVRASPVTRELPVVMLSARAGEEAAIEGLQAGADDYLPKPFSGRELIARVRSHLSLATLRREASAEIETQRELLEQTLRQLPAGVILAEAPSGRILMANAQVSEILGRIPAGAGGTDVYATDRLQTLAREPVEPGHAPMARAIDGREVIRDELLLYRTLEEQLVTLLVNAAPIEDAAGEVTAGVVVFQDVTERVRTERLLARQRDILAMVARGAPLDESLSAITETVERLSSRGGQASIMLLTPDGAHLTTGVAPSLPAAYGEAIDGMEIGPKHGSCGTAAHRRETVAVTDTFSDPLWADFRELAVEHGLRSCWSIPVFVSGGELVGTFAVYHPQPATPSPEDQQIVELLAQTAAVAIERDRDVRARAREVQARMRQLSELQASLLPPALPPIPGLGVATAFHPGDRTLEVGGDFYDVFPLGDGSWGIVIGDVCGHGATAAAVTALTRHTTRAIARLTTDPSQVLVDVSETLRESGYDRYCTAVYGRILSGTHGFQLELAIAGHPPPLIRRRGGALEWLEDHGPVLGVLPDPAFPTISAALAPGDLLLLYTDGLIERNPRLPQDDDLARMVGALADADANERLATLAAAALGSPPQNRDDVAVLMLQADPASGPGPAPQVVEPLLAGYRES